MAKSKRNTNFWNGEPKQPKPPKPRTKSNTKRERKKPDLRWLFAALVLIIAIVAAVVANTDYTRTDSTKFANVLDVDNGDLKINWDRYQTVNIELSEPLNITESGTYHLTGTLTGGITIDAGVSEVRLILDSAMIFNPTGPAILCYSAEDIVIETAGQSTVISGNTYDSSYDEDITGTIYSKADLTFQGTGELSITTGYQDAIVGKDDVKFNTGTYKIAAADDGVRGKDSVYIVDADLTIDATATAIKTTNELDTGKGFILIEGGNLNLATKENKGLAATNYILIYGGDINLETYDDAIHSDQYIGITGGTININSGDDGIHANTELIIDGGDINIEKAYEGVEAQVITINDGDLNIIANDDGINAGGGADNSATTTNKNHKTIGAFDADENCVLTINGGNIYVNSAGDGVDSNGYLYFNGGTTTVDGPTNNGNGSLDSGLGIIMNGGEVLAVGSSGMAEAPNENSSINNISVYFNKIHPAETTVTIKDSTDNTIIEHTSMKQFAHLTFGSAKLQFGETYTLYIDGDEYTKFTINNITNTIGKNENSFIRK